MTEPRPLTLETPAEHPFAEFVRILGKGKRGARGLTREEARAAMTLLLEGKVEDTQLGAFLMLLRHKEESAEELAGFTEALTTASISSSDGQMSLRRTSLPSTTPSTSFSMSKRMVPAMA